jgi:hypothetical protein
MIWKRFWFYVGLPRRAGRLLLVMTLPFTGCSLFGERDQPAKIVLEDVSSDSSGAEYPVIVCNNSGHVVLGWTSNPTGYNSIWIVEKDRGGQWEPRYNLSHNAIDARSLTLCYDSSGTLHAAWQQLVPIGGTATWVLFYTNRPLGGSWAEPETLWFPYPTQPLLSADYSGRVHLLYSGGSGIFRFCYSYCDPGGQWAPARDIGGGDLAQCADLSVRRDGKVYVVWTEVENSLGQVFYAIKDPSGNWSTQANICPTNGWCFWPSVYSDQLRTYVVFMDQETQNRLLVLSQTGDSAWSSPEVAPGIVPGQTALAVDVDDRLLVASYLDCQLQLYRRDSTWSTIADNSETGLGGEGLCMAVDRGANVIHLAWYAQSGPTDDKPMEVYYAEVEEK